MRHVVVCPVASDGSVEWYVPVCLVVWATVRDALIGDSETPSHVPTLLKHGKVRICMGKQSRSM